MTSAHPRTLSRRLFCAAPLAAMVTPLRAGLAAAEPGWPRRPVRLVSQPADGARNEALARTLAAGLAQRWRQPVIVEYRPGIDGLACVEAFLAAHDDHVLLLGPTGVWTTLHLVHDTLSFDAARDLVPLAPVVQDFVAVAVAPRLGLAGLDEVLEAARRQPGKLTWASAPHASYLAFSAFLKSTGTELTFVPTRTPVGPLADLVEGRIDLALLPLPPTIGPAQSGKVRLVAIASTERAPRALDVPTVGEAGFPSLALYNGHSLFGARGMPEALRARIADDVAATLRHPAIAERLIRMGYRPRLESPATFQALLQRERARWTEVAQANPVAMRTQ